MNLTPISALHYSSEQLSDFLGECFEGYSIPVSLSSERFAQRFGAEDISLSDSCVWLNGEMLVAVAIITRRAETARLAALGSNRMSEGNYPRQVVAVGRRLRNYRRSSHSQNRGS